MRIIPAIDLKDGKCVRLLKGDFERTTEYSSDPAAVGRQFAALNVQDLHLVDLDGARSGEQQNHEIVTGIVRETGFDVQLGGGIRSRGDVERWLNRGVTRCVVGSVAIEQPEMVKDWIREFGSDHIVLALDVRFDSSGEPMLTTHGWTTDSGVSLWSYLDGFDPIQHVLCTDVDRDGAMLGPSVDLYRNILARYDGIQLQASGGVRNLYDLEILRSIGCPAAISGRALLDGEISAEEVSSFRQSA